MDAEPLFELIVCLHTSVRFRSGGGECHATVDAGPRHMDVVVDCAFRLAEEVEQLNLAAPAEFAFKQIDRVERNDALLML